MKTLLLLSLFSISALAADPLFTSVTYYDGLGQKFRKETVSAWPRCQEKMRARKIFLDRSNELREVAYWDEQGKIHEAGKSNHPHVHKIVNEMFARSQVSGNPCVKEVPEEKPETDSDSSRGTLQ